MASQILIAEWFESSRSDSGWNFRPNAGAARRLAYFHYGCLTVLVAGLFLPLLCGLICVGITVALDSVLPSDWIQVLVCIGCGLSLAGSSPLLYTLARHFFRKSLRDNWLTLSVATGGPVICGKKVLIECGRAKSVVVRTEIKSSDEYTETFHFVEIVQILESAAPVAVPIPQRFLGFWDEKPTNENRSRDFARALAHALGVTGPGVP